MDTKPSKSKGHLTPLKHPAVEALVSYSLQDARVRDGHQRITTGHLTPLKHPAVEASTLQSQHNCRRGPRFLLKTRDIQVIVIQGSLEDTASIPYHLLASSLFSMLPLGEKGFILFLLSCLLPAVSFIPRYQ